MDCLRLPIDILANLSAVSEISCVVLPLITEAANNQHKFP